MSSGGKRPGAGRRRGTPNKATVKAREAIALFVDGNSAQLQALLDEIRAKDGPRAAWDCIMDLVEYHVPKLARSEIVGEGGGPVKHQVNIVDPTRRADRDPAQLDHTPIPG